MKTSSNVFVERFQQALTKASPDNVNTYVVAYSGGMDSHVLLYLCHYLKLPVRAIHINHGLQQEADTWSVHCRDVCTALKIPFENIDVDANAGKRESPEDAARKARYKAFEETLKVGECLLTAHHKDDQSETILLQLFRGAGPAGLASMPELKDLGKGKHARPLLGFDRKELQEYAEEKQLVWVEDPSNLNTDYDRNLVRQKILPMIKERWQKVSDSLSQVAAQQQDVLSLVEDMAAIDLGGIATQQINVVSIHALKCLSRTRQLNVLRFWIRKYGKDAPTSNVLREIIDGVVMATEDAVPVVMWQGTEVRRYKEGLYLLEKMEHNEVKTYQWKPEKNLVLDGLNLELSVKLTEGQGLSPDLMEKNLKVSFRQGGEKIQPVGRKNTHSLKTLMQDAGIPPWERSRIPLIYSGDELVYVCGYWLSDKFAVEAGGWLPVCQ